jgi:hypothetical protein
MFRQNNFTVDFSVGDSIVVFWTNGSFNAQITARTEHPTVTISVGGGSGATAQAGLHGGRVIGAFVTAPGAGYTNVPIVSISGGTGAGAAARESKGSVR